MATEVLSQILAVPGKRFRADEVVERLRAAILSGQLPPEEPLREAVLADLMGVSRGPIREALGRLEREGLVMTGPTGRTYVARLSARDLEEVYSLRASFERLAVQYACANASDEDFADLQAVVDQMAVFVGRGITEQEAADLDLNFHDVLYRASGHHRLQSYWETLRPQVYIFMLSRNVANADFREQAVRGHQEIVDALKARDTARANALMDQHLAVAYERVSTSYADRESRAALPVEGSGRDRRR